MSYHHHPRPVPPKVSARRATHLPQILSPHLQAQPYHPVTPPGSFCLLLSALRHPLFRGRGQGIKSTPPEPEE